MATLVLSAVGSIAAGSTLPGVSLLGGAVTSGALGKMVGAVAGAYVDQALFGSSGQSKVVEAPAQNPSDLQVLSSAEGTVVPRVYGRARLGGQIIWATQYELEIVQSGQVSSGGKGLGSPQPQQPTPATQETLYYANFAVSLCEGEITQIGRVWADGKEIDLSKFTTRLHVGTESQHVDSLIAAKQGTGNAPAYRGLAYIVFERMPLADFGNRIPQLNFEVFRSIGDFENRVTAVTVIPSSGEFAYDSVEVLRDAGGGETIAENVHSRQGGTDWTVSMDHLQASLPNCRSAGLFVSWFGDDLRAAQCEIRPGVEIASKKNTPYSWAVAGESRASAHLVSKKNGRPAYGGTPSDTSVIRAIADLKTRGLKVTFYPFILMDVPEGNTLPDPYNGTMGQPVYPWRGRITCNPAPGQAGSPDKTATAGTQIKAFAGNCQVGDFALNGQSVVYTGPAEWSFRRMILHYAHLCAAAGGVDAFVIGSELRGLSWVRDSVNHYPFVDELVQLAADVKSVLGSGTKVTYGADWSEYFGHQPPDGSGDVYFHLDPLWASSNIDAIGIDLYWPLADWRDGRGHLDRLDGVLSPYELDYLKSNLTGGEGYDWFYASQADRDAQTRTPITDGAGKPWVFRYKDVKNWWLNSHYNRPGGVEAATPTAWVPQSKPIWFTEVGCPAVDKGANQPNVFYDPKSSESALPHYAHAVRDDLMQRRYLQAVYDYYDAAHPDYQPGANPNSTLYYGRMVDHDNIYAYTWDARPYPAFPSDSASWGDTANWTFGHWLNGRLGGAPLSALVRRILEEYGFTAFTADALTGYVEGYVLDQVMSARDALQPLELSFFVDSREAGDVIEFLHRGRTEPIANLLTDSLVETSAEAQLYELTRAQETDLPAVAKLSYSEGGADYRMAAVEAKRIAAGTSRVATAQLPLVMSQSTMQAIAEAWLYDAWSARERATFSLPPSMLAFEPGDNLSLSVQGRSYLLRITETAEDAAKQVTALSINPNVYTATQTQERILRHTLPSVYGPALAVFMDLPLLRGDEDPVKGYVAARQSPWPGGVAFYRSPDTANFHLKALANSPAVMGETLTDFAPGPEGRWDHANILRVRLYSGSLQSLTELELLSGGNAAAIETADGAWEVVQFLTAQLVADKTYNLSGLLRGLAGTERTMGTPVAAGARFVLLNSALAQVDMTQNDVGISYQWKYGPKVHDIGHASYQDKTHSFQGLGLRPLSPVHVRGVKVSGDIVLSWVRRTRWGGDSWETIEVPLAEDSEHYEVDVLMDGNVVRTLSAQSPSVVYGAADQIADFGVAPSQFEVDVFQLSPSYGRGAERHAIIAV